MEPLKESTWIFGDIHGHYAPLKALADEILRQDKNPQFIFLGDYIDRGPDSKKVIDFILGLGNKATCLMGNHEELLIDTFNDTYPSKLTYNNPWFNNGFLDTLKSFGYKDVLDFEQNLDKKYRDFFYNLKIIHSFKVPARKKDVNFICVHAGISPGISVKEQLQLQDVSQIKHLLYYNNKNIENSCLWIRHNYIWGNEPEWENYIVLFGHTPIKTLKGYLTSNTKHLLNDSEIRPGEYHELLPFVDLHPNTKKVKRIALDTGVAYNGRLTAINIQPANFLVENPRVVVLQASAAPPYQLKQYEFNIQT